MRSKDFFRDLTKFTKEYWVEVAILVFAMAIVFEIIKRIFILFGKNYFTYDLL